MEVVSNTTLDFTTSCVEPNPLYDYTGVVTFGAGKDDNRCFFASNVEQLGKKSISFGERLEEEFPEAMSRYFCFADIEPEIKACILYWYRGWECASCG
jgi:hypothetical protein